MISIQTKLSSCYFQTDYGNNQWEHRIVCNWIGKTTCKTPNACGLQQLVLCLVAKRPKMINSLAKNNVHKPIRLGYILHVCLQTIFASCNGIVRFFLYRSIFVLPIPNLSYSVSFNDILLLHISLWWLSKTIHSALLANPICNHSRSFCKIVICYPCIN